MDQSIYSRKNLNRKILSKQINLTKDPIWDLLRKVTIPASVGSLFQTFYNLVDTWFAGRISAEAIGAIAKSFPIYFTIIAVGVGIGAATNAMIGNSIGEKKHRVASMYIAQSLIFALLISIVVTLFGLNASNFLLGVMGSRCCRYCTYTRIFRYYFLRYIYCNDSNFIKWSLKRTR